MDAIAEQFEPAKTNDELDEEEEMQEKECKFKLWEQKQAIKLQNIQLEDFLDSQTIAAINNVLITG